MITILLCVASAALGAAGYRYMLKKDPVTLEKWAAEAKEAGKKLSDNF
jgi:hypothetical protein